VPADRDGTRHHHDLRQAIWSPVAVIGGSSCSSRPREHLVRPEVGHPQMNDLVEVYGGGSWSKLNKVAMPSSSPAFFAAVRISVPGRDHGALLANGSRSAAASADRSAASSRRRSSPRCGRRSSSSPPTSLILYNVIQIVEDVVLARMGMHPQKSI
jgi:hypothetical protein